MANAKIARLMSAKSVQLLDECKRIAAARLPGVIKQVLEKADDALFDSADKASSSQRQNMFFDAMRELRIKRANIETQFVSFFQQSYEDTFNPVVTVDSRHAGELKLSLVEASDMEEDLAVSNFVDKVKSNCREELFALDKRMGLLLSDPDLEQTKNPVAPDIIGRAFRDACKELASGIDVKLILYKLLDRFLTPDINAMYREINQFLVQNDVLPKISSNVQRSSPGRRTRVIIESEGGTTEAAGADVFSTLQQLMADGAAGPLLGGGAGGVAHGPGGGVPGMGLPAGAGHAAAYAAGGPLAAHGGAAPGNYVQSTPVVVSRLTELQQGRTATVLPNAVGFDPQALQVGSVNVVHMLKASGAVGPLNATDSTTFDIVAILFDYILSDRSIPDAMKALIGRLQIPVLKVAMLDKEVFSKKSHPARRLLDIMANAAIGCGDGAQAQDALAAKMAGAIDTIIEEFDSDVGVFARVLADFEAFVEAEARQAQQRAESAARSLRARERVVLSKIKVDAALKPFLEGPELREFIRQFVLDYWRQLLIITHAEHGEDGAPFKQQLGTLSDLIWSVEPKSTPEERQALSARLPRLLKALREGMRALDMDPRRASQFLSMLASVHVVSVKSAVEASIAERKLKQIEEAEQARAARLADEQAEAAKVAASEDERMQFMKQGMARLFEHEGVPVEELNLGELDFNLDALEPNAETPAAAPVAAGPERDEYIERVMSMDLGDWVEFQQHDGSTPRFRFTWISPATGRYLFTNRQGQKALDTSMQGLANEFRKGTAKIIKTEPDPLFDRAISNLMERLELQAAG